jgi:hypothetical protein
MDDMAIVDAVDAPTVVPRALAGSVYRDSLFPRSEYTATWVALSEALSKRDACRRMVDLLWLAHDDGCEAELASLLVDDLAAGRLPQARDLKARPLAHAGRARRQGGLARRPLPCSPRRGRDRRA